MFYVYILLLDEIPIYAGMTNNPVNRFRRHYLANDCGTYKVLRYYLFNNNKIVRMKLVYCTNDKNDAFRTEGHVITLLDKAGFKIINLRHNYSDKASFPQLHEKIKTPHKIFTETLFKPIRDNINEIHKEYGYK